MDARKVLDYYSREDVKKALLESAKNREVVGVFISGAFSKRPNTLVYPQDILSQVRSGVVEFHSSLEHWKNPMSLQERTGFDLILDLDCNKFEHGKIATQVLVWTLEKHGISCSIKFSGNTGFHVGIPWISIPKEINLKPTQRQFPDVARRVARYIRFFLKDRLEEKLLASASVEDLAAQAEKPLEKVKQEKGIDPFQIVDIDPILISPRHLYRMPYSMNKKTSLVSLPVSKEALPSFKKEDATPEKITCEEKFLDCGKEGEADVLFAEGLDWSTKHETKRESKPRPSLKTKIPEDLFPPCVKNIQSGLKDGKKRAVFLLINFLHSLKWNWEEIQSFLIEWNRKNQPPLPETYLVTSVRYYQRRKQFPPPNCSQEGWYESLGVCNPDSNCGSTKTIKNPVNYPFRLMSSRSKKRRKRL